MSTYTLYAAPGVFNLSGASEISNLELDPGVGIFGLAGQAVSFSAPMNRTLIAATGIFSLTGHHVTFVNPPLPNFAWARVTAVTAGQYRGQDYYPGDVFDIYAAGDFSNSTVNYQPASSGTVGFGWMSIVPSSTPLYSWLSANNASYLPAQDPLRRFVY